MAHICFHDFPVSSKPNFYGGIYQIRGTVSRENIPGKYKVVLFDAFSKLMVAQKNSDNDGSFVFTHLKYIDNGYFLVAYDHTGTPLNAAIADLVTPEPMP